MNSAPSSSLLLSQAVRSTVAVAGGRFIHKIAHPKLQHCNTHTHTHSVSKGPCARVIWSWNDTSRREREEREFVYSECVPACLVSRRTADTVVRGRQREAPTAAAAAAVRT